MEIVVSMESESLSIPVDNPFQLDIDDAVGKIEGFVSSKGTSLNGLNIKVLLPKMVRGIAGCERGCPADAMYFVSEGFMNFKLDYIEGGILTANAVTQNGKELSIKMFPDF